MTITLSRRCARDRNASYRLRCWRSPPPARPNGRAGGTTGRRMGMLAARSLLVVQSQRPAGSANALSMDMILLDWLLPRQQVVCRA